LSKTKNIKNVKNEAKIKKNVKILTPMIPR